MKEECLKAYEDYKKGMKYKDIAKKYKVSESAVKSWAARYWKTGKVATENKKVATISDKKLRRKSGGAPKGNKNALGNIGGGAPKGNKNNYKHGLYETIEFDFLTDEEKDMLREIGHIDEEVELEKQIVLCSIRERRLIKSIQEKKDARGGLSLESVIKRKLETKGSVMDAKQTQDETTTKTISSFELMLRLEAELTRVQAKKTRCIEALSKLRSEKENKDKDTLGENTEEVVHIFIPENNR